MATPVFRPQKNELCFVPKMSTHFLWWCINSEAFPLIALPHLLRRKPPKLEDDDKSDPSQGLMKLMQQMYDDGDDEMKRTIKKSWYESQQKRKAESDVMDM